VLQGGPSMRASGKGGSWDVSVKGSPSGGKVVLKAKGGGGNARSGLKCDLKVGGGKCRLIMEVGMLSE
jgi:hypothetical protein